MNFSRLCELVSQARTEQQLLFQLEVVAVLVRGVWTARGEFLFTGQLAIIWDFLLLQFHEEGYIEREKLKQTLKISIPGDELKELLLKIAVLHEDKKWVLKQDPDQTFAEKYPVVVQKFKNDWDQRKKSILSSLGLFDTTSVNVSPSSTIASNQKEQLKSYLTILFQEYGVCSMAFIKQKLEHLRRDDTHTYNLLRAGVEHKVLLEALKSIANTLHNTYFLKSTGNEKVDKYREVILSVFAGDNNKAKKSEFNTAAQNKLGEPIPTTQYTKLLKEFAVNKGNYWIFKTGNGE